MFYTPFDPLVWHTICPPTIPPIVPAFVSVMTTISVAKFMGGQNGYCSHGEGFGETPDGFCDVFDSDMCRQFGAAR